jgi:tetratricopeptide (TPR) repeat protein
MSFNVQEVAQLLKQAKENEKPYVFFTGAGCSVKADVPSATALIQEICEKFPIQVKNLDPEKDKYNYGKYMSALDKDERRRLLKPHIIDNKKINWAHIALACLMQAGYVERVLTFNFDSILSRACNLFGLHPSIYDFATANPHLYHLINDPSIVHLHGQGTGFVQLNTANETKEHTEKLSDFIANTLNSNPSLFIGYSGNADAFFPLLEEKYSEQHRLIWTGTRKAIEELDSESVKTFLTKNNNITHYIGDIYADKFLIQLAKELDCFPPELFLNPYVFLNKQLDFIQDYPLSDGLDVLSNLREYLKEQSKNPLIDSLYTAIIHKYPTKESTLELSSDAIDDVMWAYIQQAHLLANNKQFESCLKLYEQALKIQENHLGCISNYGISLNDYAYLKKDENLYLNTFEQYEKALIIQPDSVTNLGNYGNALSDLASYKGDDKLFNKAFEQYEKALKIEPTHTQNLSNYGSALSDFAKLKNDEELFIKAAKQYETALKNSPLNVTSSNSYGYVLYYLGKLKNDEQLLNKALKQFENAITIEPNNTYNISCYYALTQKFVLSKQNLEHAEEHSTLPSFNHLNTDKDLDNVRNKPWFKDLLERLKAKEEAKKVA